MWHLFVLCYTIAMPPLSMVTLLVYLLRPNRWTFFVGLVFAMGTLGIWLLWSADASRGLIH